MKIAKRILFLLLVAAALSWGWTLYSPGESASPPTTSVATRGTVEQSVLASGIIEAKQLVSVGARVSGQIETLSVTLGQEVAQGGLIAQIDSQDQQNAVLQAQADLANIEAQIAAKNASLRKAELILERQEKLNSQDYVSKEEVEAAISDVLVDKAELQALEAQKSSAEVTVSTAQIALARTTIKAPIAGTVVAIVVDEGQTVNASQNAPTIVKIADLDTMVVKAEISEADVVHVHAGQQVVFSILGEPESAFTAVVRDVEPAPSEIKDSDTISTDEAIYYNGMLDVANPDHRLRIGMTTQVSIILNKVEDALTVPASALSRAADGSYVVQVYDPATGESHRQTVEVGLNDKVTAEITSGLTEGQRVVTGSVIAPAAAQSNTRMPPMGL
ncbi:efflux RND transporter periplasmic adaptor subunit [Actibacterium lipolyticum]|uniref:Macrolide export protein MacA n=1 Tax=Actibacterium lipolyticum TaxID=1524263 RepID=A0A238KJ79_9RHOB|nr:efflux RND transporter periplasmic adaptor subunit [Actibacterium lipolyticum]SMX42929.1 Macrolide export protein MacA [Actibacterium lipolyticum]